jgi:hypothetical protein
MGNENPLKHGIPGLIDRVQTRLIEINKHESVALSNFIGISVIRACTRRTHAAEDVPRFDVKSPRWERVKNIAFLLGNNQEWEVQPRYEQQLGSQNDIGVGTVHLEGDEHLSVFHNTLFLPPTVQEMRAQLAATAVADAFPARGPTSTRPYVALHPSPSETQHYTEDIVTRRSLGI